MSSYHLRWIALQSMAISICEHLYAFVSYNLEDKFKCVIFENISMTRKLVNAYF